MSRVGKKPIVLASGVSVKMTGSVIEVKGSKGVLTRETFGRISLEQKGNELFITPGVQPAKQSKKQAGRVGAFWGLYRTLVANMVHGVSEGYSKTLEIQGTGYRANMDGKKLNLVLGFSHPVLLEPLPGIAFDVDKTGKVTIQGIDKELVGRVAAEVRSVRSVEPYKGKGVRYVGEVVKLKVGKSAGKK
jgi:large subunit ribosomal protein L6